MRFGQSNEELTGEDVCVECKRLIISGNRFETTKPPQEEVTGATSPCAETGHWGDYPRSMEGCKASGCARLLGRIV